MTGGTPAAAAMRVSPAPCTCLKSSCWRSLPTTSTFAPPPRKSVLYAFAAPSWPCLKFSTQASKAAFVMVGSSETTMFGVAPCWRKELLCSVMDMSAPISRRMGVSQLMPRYGESGSGVGAKWATAERSRTTGARPLPGPPGM